MPWLSLKSNPFWSFFKPSPWDFMTHIGDIHPGTLWTTNENGFISPTDGRSITAAEQAYLNQYNSERKELNDSSRKAVDALMQRILPLSDACYKELTDFKALAIQSDISWLHDHPAGSDFYSEGANGDATGDWALSRLQRYMEEAGLEFDLAEIPEKVANGITTPIVIDLNGDGIKTTSLLSKKTVFFDIDGDEKKDETAWIYGDDAFLAVDRNGNGVIDGINELFGGRHRGAGFAKLAEFDSNGDGVVDKNDERYSELLLWQDLNMNGRTDINELRTAEAAGLESISLNYVSQNVCENGNLLGEVSSAIVNGQKVDAIDVSFRFREITAPAVDSLDHAPMDSLILSVSNFKSVATTGYLPESFDEFMIDFSHLTDKSIDPQLPSAHWFSNNESSGEFPHSFEYFPVSQVDLGKTVTPSTAISVFLPSLDTTPMGLAFTEPAITMSCSIM